MIIYCHNSKVLVILTSTFFIFSRSSTFKQLSSSVHNQLTFRGGIADLHRRYIKISNRPQSIRACKHSFLLIFSIFRLVEGVFQYRPVSSVKDFSSHTLSLPGREKHSVVWETQSSVCCVSPRPTDQTDWATLSYWELLWASAGAIRMATRERLQNGETVWMLLKRRYQF